MEPRPSRRLRFDDQPPNAGALARALAARALTTVYRRMLFLAYPLEELGVQRVRCTVAADFRVLGEDDAEAYARFHAAVPAAEVRRRLACGHRCYAAWHEGEIVDAGWAATGVVFVPYLDRHLLLGAGDIYHYESYTRPALRKRGLYMARNAFAARLNAAEGFRRSVALVAAENAPVWAVLTRCGLRTRGIYSYLRLGPWGVHRWRGVGGERLPPLVRTRAVPAGAAS
jgi:hypothetical protein